MQRSALLIAALGGAVFLTADLEAAVSYTTVGATYTQNFDSLPAHSAARQH